MSDADRTDKPKYKPGGFIPGIDTSTVRDATQRVNEAVRHAADETGEGLRGLFRQAQRGIQEDDSQ
jgi:hypothetical protein